ncbi:uncharacterized protein METZ01_LOCUS277326, partial [marine metagenome]
VPGFEDNDDAVLEAFRDEKERVDEHGYVVAMSHFYRGEVSRIMVWRQRLDTTTTWAIT